MASIQSRKHKDGSVTHRVLWRDGGRQRSLTFEDITSAEGFRSNIDAYGSTEALAILDITDTSDEQTLGEWVDQYVDTLAGIGDGTRKQYRRYAAHDLAALRPLPLPAITETTEPTRPVSDSSTVKRSLACKISAVIASITRLA